MEHQQPPPPPPPPVPRRLPAWWPAVPVGAVLLFAVVATSAREPAAEETAAPATTTEATTTTTEPRPGSPAVYEEIESSTDCAELQEMFDIAAGYNDRAEPGTEEFAWTLGYMKAADARLAEIGCY